MNTQSNCTYTISSTVHKHALYTPTPHTHALHTHPTHTCIIHPPYTLALHTHPTHMHHTYPPYTHAPYIPTHPPTQARAITAHELISHPSCLTTLTHMLQHDIQAALSASQLLLMTTRVSAALCGLCVQAGVLQVRVLGRGGSFRNEKYRMCHQHTLCTSTKTHVHPNNTQDTCMY